MQRTAGRLGTAAAAALLGLALPAAAAAQDSPTAEWHGGWVETSQLDVAPSTAPAIPAPLTSLPRQARALAAAGRVDAAHVAVVSMTDLNLTADQRYAMMQDLRGSGGAALQHALRAVIVTGTATGYQRSLADYLRMTGTDPATVVALDTGNDGVTLYTM